MGCCGGIKARDRKFAGEQITCESEYYRRLQRDIVLKNMRINSIGGQKVRNTKDGSLEKGSFHKALKQK